jgi:signal recognition particle subunit SEC65
MVNDAKNKLDMMFNEIMNKNTNSIKSERPELEKIRNIAERTGEYYQTVARPAPIIIKKKNPEITWGKQIYVIKKSGEIDTGIITDVDWDNDKLQIILSSTHRYAYGKLSDMGVKWFLAKGEAEAKLKARTETDKKIHCILTYSTETKFPKFWVGKEIFILSPESNEVLITKISGITGFQNKSMSSGTITYADNNGEPHSIDITEYDTRLFIDLPSAQIAYSEATGSPASSLAIVHVD